MFLSLPDAFLRNQVANLLNQDQISMPGYYTSRKRRLLFQCRLILNLINPLLVEEFSENDALIFRQECLQVYADEIIPNIPYIGGGKNPFSAYLLLTSIALTIYRVLQKRGKGLEKAGGIICRGMKLIVERVPRLFLRIFGAWTYSRFRYPRWQREALASQRVQYPEDWIFSFVEGNDEGFNFGLDIQACGIMKYLQTEGAVELTPYLCAVDYITHYALGIELHRTQALAFGCEKCDFRFIVKGSPVEPAWPPVFPEQKCGK